MKTALLIVLFVVGTLAFKKVWDSKQAGQERWLCLALAVICWAAMAVLGYGIP